MPHTQQAPKSPQSRTSLGRVTKSSARLRKNPRRHVRNEFTTQSSFTLDQSGLKPEQDCPFDTGLPLDELFGSPVGFGFSKTNDATLAPDQLCAIQATASFSGKCPKVHSAGVAKTRTQNHQAQSSVPTPLDVNHQLGSSSEEKIFRETRAQSQVTVAAQQRAEAAYRRQRMAQEREQTAVLRAEMEVERARMLKEMTGGSRRPSYCLELEDLKEEAPDEVRENLDKCLNDYTVEEKNARNSLSNGYSRSAVITKDESRGEKDKHQDSQEQARENDENGNTERRNSTGEQSDQDAQITEKQDLLQTIKDRSAQASPSNVCIEENEQSRDHSETLELNAGVVEEPKQNEEVSIGDNADASQNHTSAEKPANNCNDVTTTANEDSSMTHEYSTTNDENLEIKMQDSSEGSDQVQDTTNNVNSDGCDTEPVKMADDLNAENVLSLNTEESGNEQQQQQHQRGIEHVENIDNSSNQTQAVENVSTTQNLESVNREHEEVTS